ncbi:MAG: aminotransferase class V-fold PLP-dependent enzyme [Rhodothermaceae bacterium]|nr:aminotransferase class V-fold PLP-dependent enzyme [Gammaproteobacteria bacterium]MXW15589.1 aminotransferase class V-fold PLP-dependent enzyme [Rhodothermaceae bacterium]MYC05469.1 aminotransferase class V-fold PLP-dependent enzyme [Rhodothermaceae bacterium]MYI17282.1 aminotransferase class V-fold PLP-dependent enzyme [Rhodothermaceae bacterium]
MIYLDYAATTPADQTVIDIIIQHLGLEGIFGNPSSRYHHFGRMAEAAVETARSHLAELIGADSAEIVWTSGATESINLAIKGIVEGRSQQGTHIVTSNLEHKAVLDPCAYLTGKGFEITYVAPDQDGLITPEKIDEALRDDTILVSLMHVNNEVGTITDIDKIGQITRNRGIPFHVDAAQSSARLPIDLNKVPVDFLSLSGHKMYGPKGVGALYIRNRSGINIKPQMHGGGQESGIRPGTLPTHQLVGMGEAARLAKQRLYQDAKMIAALDKYLLDSIMEIESTTLNGNQKHRVPGILNVSFANVENESLIMSLKDVAISSGSACTSSRIEPSHVLLGLGISEDTVNCSVRFSIGRQTTMDEIGTAAMQVKKSVDLLRELSPQWRSQSYDKLLQSDNTTTNIAVTRESIV